ncbi:MAG: hypothetical protein ABFD50_21255 [Smithella sp.]
MKTLIISKTGRIYFVPAGRSKRCRGVVPVNAAQTMSQIDAAGTEKNPFRKEI